MQLYRKIEFRDRNTREEKHWGAWNVVIHIRYLMLEKDKNRLAIRYDKIRNTEVLQCIGKERKFRKYLITGIDRLIGHNLRHPRWLIKLRERLLAWLRTTSITVQQFSTLQPSHFWSNIILIKLFRNNILVDKIMSSIFQ